MRKKTSSTDTSKRGKAGRKLTDLTPKRVKGGDAASVKGGEEYLKVKLTDVIISG